MIISRKYITFLRIWRVYGEALERYIIYGINVQNSLEYISFEAYT